MRADSLLRVADATRADGLNLADLTPGARMVALRGALLGGSAALVGTVSHVAGDGLLPSAPAYLVFVLAVVAVSGALSLTRISRRTMVGALVGGQAVMHLLLASLAGHTDGASTAAGATTDPGVGWLTHQMDHIAAQGLPMVLAHTLGAVAFGLFLAFAEETLWDRLVRGVLASHFRRLQARRARAALRELAMSVPPAPRAAAFDWQRWHATPVEARPDTARRGPPDLLTV